MRLDQAPTELDRLLEHAREGYSGFIQDLAYLVDIDSGTRTTSGVDHVSGWMQEQLLRLGASVVRHPHHGLGDTMVATFDGRPGGPTVLVVGHADTVFEAGTAAQRPFVVDGSRAMGPGVGDMKGGLVMGLYALRALRSAATTARDWLPVGRLVFIVNPDEEIGSPASRPIIEKQARQAHAALVLEGGRPDGAVVSARAGMLHVRIAIVGREAHAGVEPEVGRSAIVEAAHKIIALTELTDHRAGVTVNVGEIYGGTRPNVVPAEATMIVDVRATTLEQMAAIESAIKSIVATAAVTETTSSLEMLARYAPMERTAGSGRLVDMATAIAAGIGFELRCTATRGASDANTIAGAGVPTLDGLGLVGGRWHSAGEYVELDSIVTRTALLAALIAATGRGDTLADQT